MICGEIFVEMCCELVLEVLFWEWIVDKGSVLWKVEFSVGLEVVEVFIKD